MAIKYKAWGRLSRLPRIDTVEIIRETKSTVTFPDGSGEHKRTDWHAYFDTWEEARDYLLEHAQADAAAAKLRLRAAHRHIDNILKMKKP